MRLGAIRLDEESQGRLDDLALPRPVTHRTDRAAHEVGSDQYARHAQPSGYVRERAGEHRNGGDACRLEGACDESDRLVAHRLGRDQETRIHLLGTEPLHPLRRHLRAQPNLGGGAGEGVVIIGEAHPAFGLQVAQHR